MRQIILPTSKLIKLSDPGILIYPVANMNDIAKLDRFSVQSNLLRCSDLDLLSINTPDVINWLEDNVPKL